MSRRKIVIVSDSEERTETEHLVKGFVMNSVVVHGRFCGQCFSAWAFFVDSVLVHGRFGGQCFNIKQIVSYIYTEKGFDC